MRGGTGAGGAPSSRAKPLPEHALHPDDGLSWRRLKGAVRQGADQAAAAAALAPEAWVVQHAEVLQQDTGETTYFVAGEIIDLLCMYSLQVSLSTFCQGPVFFHTASAPLSIRRQTWDM